MPARKLKRRSYASSHRSINFKKIAGGIALVMLLGVTTVHYLFPSPKQAALSDQIVPTSINQNFEIQVKACLIPLTQAQLGYTLDISSGFRSFAEQDQLFAQGRTDAGDIVTQAKGGQSTHNFGLAVDLVEHTLGYDINWDKVGKIASYCGLEHGDRGYQDLPHFQYLGKLSLKQLQQGLQPAPLKLPCSLLKTRFQKQQPITTADLKTCHIPSV